MTNIQPWCTPFPVLSQSIVPYLVLAQFYLLSLFPLFPHLFAKKCWDQMPWSLFSECWIFKPTFSLSSFIFIKRLFSSSLSAIRVVLSAYLRLLTFLPAILIPAVLHPTQCFAWCTLLLLLSRFSHVWLLVTLWTAAYQAPPSTDFPGKSIGVGWTMGYPASFPQYSVE